MLLVLVVRLLHHSVEFGGGGADEVAQHVGDEGCVYVGSVLVDDAAMYSDVGAVLADGGHGWCEEQEGDATAHVEVADLGEDGERWVVDHHAVLRVVVVFEVAIGIEGAHHWAVAHVEVLPCPCQHGIIYQWRCVTVVRGLLWLEFLHESIVVLYFLAHFLAGLKCLLYLCSGPLPVMGLDPDSRRFLI